MLGARARRLDTTHSSPDLRAWALRPTWCVCTRTTSGCTTCETHQHPLAGCHCAGSLSARALLVGWAVAGRCSGATRAPERECGWSYAHTHAHSDVANSSTRARALFVGARRNGEGQVLKRTRCARNRVLIPRSSWSEECREKIECAGTLARGKLAESSHAQGKGDDTSQKRSKCQPRCL